MSVDNPAAKRQLPFGSKKEHRRFIRNVKAIPGQFQHPLVVANVDMNKISNAVSRTCTERRTISLLKKQEAT